MAYVPNPQDTTNPTDAISAETAQAEFRALKTYLATLVFATGTRIPTRQTILNAPVDVNGIAAFLAISATALGVDLLATNSNGMTATWANGYAGSGAVDAIQVIGNDILNFWPTLPVSDTSYLALDYVNGVTLTTVTNGPYAAGTVNITVASVLTPAGGTLPKTTISLTLDDGSNFTVAVTNVNAGTLTLTLGTGVPVGRTLNTGTNVVGTIPLETQTLAPSQNSRTYDATKQSVLQFGGVAGSTAFLDDFGNTWTAQGGTKIQTNQFKFGTGALGGGGGTNALNGTTDFVRCQGIISLGIGSWSIRGWVQPTVLPGVNTDATCFGLFSSSGFGAFVSIDNNAGTIRWRMNLSSAGASSDIGAPVGTSLPVIGTWYFVELTFDQLAGTYRLYVNGAQEATVVSSTKIGNMAEMAVGYSTNHQAGFNGLQGYIDKFEYLPYCQHPGGTVYANPTAAPSVATVGYASDWFDTVNYKLWQVQTASVAAGASPTFKQVNRLYVGEADTSGAAVTAVRPYAIQGKFIGQKVIGLPGSSTSFSQNHNIGSQPGLKKLVATNIINDSGYSPGDEVEIFGDNDNGAHWCPIMIRTNKMLIGSVTGPHPWQIMPLNLGGTVVNLTNANWAYRFEAQRNF